MKRSGEDTGSTGKRGPSTERVVFVWDGGTTSITLSEGRSFLVGRSSRADVRIPHASLSREHARFSFDNGSLSVVDAGSKHGTRLDGRQLPPGQAAEAAPGSVVELGDVLALHQGRAVGGAAPGRGAEAWKEVDRLLPLVARGTISVLVLGETGAGKEVTAHALHRLSPRATGPFVTIHCAALPESLLEAELFGYEKGAFTGATAAKPGLLESASGGTAFLDEITEIPPSTQAKLLRAVETKSVARLGSVRAKTIDVRFVAATNRDIDALVESGKFRDDLYYRLAGFTLNVPSLRARVGEIERLAERFAAEACRGLDREPVALDPRALAAMNSYPWPGNVRELRNAMESAVLLAVEGVVRTEHLPARVTGGRDARGPAPRGRASLHEEVQELERSRILEALERAGGNQSRAARELGISRRLLLERLDVYGTPRPRKSAGARRLTVDET